MTTATHAPTVLCPLGCGHQISAEQGTVHFCVIKVRNGRKASTSREYVGTWNGLYICADDDELEAQIQLRKYSDTLQRTAECALCRSVQPCVLAGAATVCTNRPACNARGKKEIVYDRESRDYALYLDGELVGFARTFHEAEVTLDRLVFELFNRQYAAPAVKEVA